jgi:hypothetical protein
MGSHRLDPHYSAIRPRVQEAELWCKSLDLYVSSYADIQFIINLGSIAGREPYSGGTSHYTTLADNKAVFIAQPSMLSMPLTVSSSVNS